MAQVKSYGSSSMVVKITIENLAQTGGTFVAKVWFAFHDGSFSIYELGAAASPALERLAEDANTGPLTKEFSKSNAGLVQGTLFGPDGLFDDTAPGSKASVNVIQGNFCGADIVVMGSDLLDAGT